MIYTASASRHDSNFLSSPNDSRSDQFIDLLLHDGVLHVVAKGGGVSLRLLQNLAGGMINSRLNITVDRLKTYLLDNGVVHDLLDLTRFQSKKSL